MRARPSSRAFPRAGSCWVATPHGPCSFFRRIWLSSADAYVLIKSYSSDILKGPAFVEVGTPVAFRPSQMRRTCCVSSGPERLMWAFPEGGVRCLLVAYDDHRVQLRLMRGGGTVRTDLFQSDADALATAEVWREESARRIARILPSGELAADVFPHSR